MIYSVIPNFLMTAHLMLGYVHHFHYLIKQLRSHIRMNLVDGHTAESTTFDRVKRYFYRPVMFTWIEMLMLDCLSWQNNKSARKDLNEAPLET